MKKINKLIKISEIIAFSGGISAIILIFITLYINSFIPLTNFIPENNNFIRIPELFFGAFSLIFLLKMLFGRL